MYFTRLALKTENMMMDQRRMEIMHADEEFSDDGMFDSDNEGYEQPICRSGTLYLKVRRAPLQQTRRNQTIYTDKTTNLA